MENILNLKVGTVSTLNQPDFSAIWFYNVIVDTIYNVSVIKAKKQILNINILFLQDPKN